GIGAGIGGAALRAGRSIIGNALMIGIALGLTLNLLGARVPAPIFAAAELMADAAVPAALVGLGAALTRYRVRGEIGWALLVSALSLVAHPAVAYGLGVYVFALEAPQLRAAVILAAMPCGLTAYVFAALHARAEPVAASAVVLSTALGVVSVSLWLALMGGRAG
ncbi:MAG: AEC family transporter, partial [Pseudomonadota bacterium]